MSEIALSDVIGALSYALDIAEGQPPGHAVRSCLIGMRLGAELDLSASDRSDLFYALLLKDAGCSANANHHEKLDDSGYPRSLEASRLDLPMRVLAVADVYEALTADRPYRGPLPVEEALAIIDRDVLKKLNAEARGALEAYVGRSTASADPVGSTIS